MSEVQEREQLLSLLSQESRSARLLCSLSDGQGEPHALDSYMELQVFFPVLLGIQPDSFMCIIGQGLDGCLSFSLPSMSSLTSEVQPNLTQP